MIATATPLTRTGPAGSEQLAALLKAAADPLRLNVLQVLGQNSYGVLELGEMLDISQPGMSHHLKVLARAGLVEQRREGNSIFYRRRLPVADSLGEATHRALLEELDQQPLGEELESRLKTIQARRAARSREFFARHASDPGQQEDLIAEFDEYADLAGEMLDRALPDGGQAALEIGPGNGQFLNRLATRFDQVTGLDNSEAMLALAREHVSKSQLDNVSLTVGDWPQAAPPRQFDALVLNMVLHHLPAPAETFISAGRRLRHGGVLLLTELCRHDQGWARERCGDLWLGFDESELNQWGDRAGLIPLESQFLALRNGFQVQVRSFRRLTNNN